MACSRSPSRREKRRQQAAVIHSALPLDELERPKGDHNANIFERAIVLK